MPRNCAALVGLNTLWGTGDGGPILRPYPMYSAVDTVNGRATKSATPPIIRCSEVQQTVFRGADVQASYVLSKMLTDSDSGGSEPEDQYNRQSGKVDCILRPDPRGETELCVRVALWEGKAFPERQERGFRHLVTGASPGARGTPGNPHRLGTTISFPIFNEGTAHVST